jgi:hypothetical protein
MVALIEYNLGALRNPSPDRGPAETGDYVHRSIMCI